MRSDPIVTKEQYNIFGKAAFSMKKALDQMTDVYKSHFGHDDEYTELPARHKLQEVLNAMNDVRVIDTPSAFLLFGTLGAEGSWIVEIQGPKEKVLQYKDEGISPVFPNPKSISFGLILLFKRYGLEIPVLEVVQINKE
jgi:hypothetical protein